VWTAGAAAQATAGRLPGVVTGARPPSLPEPGALETVRDDLWSLGLAPERTAIELARPALTARGVVTVAEALAAEGGKLVVAGVVTHRQAPETARWPAVPGR
jgi:error-prone DNA polymerase